MKKLQKSVLIVLSVVFLSILSLVYIGLSGLKIEKQAVENQLQAALKQPVQIEQLNLEWFGLWPQVTVHQFRLLSEQGKTLIFVKEVKANIDLIRSIFSQKIQFKKLKLIQPKCVLYWQGGENFALEGFSSGAQHEILKVFSDFKGFVIQQGDIHLKGPKGLDLPIISAQAKITPTQGVLKILFSATIKGDSPLFLKGDYRFKGAENHLFLSAKGKKLEQWQALLALGGIKLHSGEGKIKANAYYQFGKLKKAACKVNLKKIHFHITKGLKTEVKFAHWAGRYQINKPRKSVWQLKGQQTLQVLPFDEFDESDFRLVLNPKKITLSANRLDIETIWTVFNKQMPQSLEALSVYNPKGFLETIDLSYDRQTQESILSVSGKNVSVVCKKIFDSDLLLETLNGQFQIIQKNQMFQIKTLKPILATQKEAVLQAKGIIECRKNQLPRVDLQASLNRLSFDQLRLFLPVNIFDLELKNWLEKAILAGQITKGDLRLKGNLADFPFQKPDSGVYEWSIGFENLRLQYDSNWPEIQKVQGNLRVEKDTMHIQVQQANILSNPVEWIEAKISPLSGQKLPVIEVTGQMQTRFETGLAFLARSPLANGLGDYLNSIDPKGKMALALNLAIPLAPKLKTKVSGKIALEDCVAHMPQMPLEVKNLTGNIHFSENEVKSNALTFAFLNEKATGSLKTEYHQNKKHLVFKLQSRFRPGVLGPFLSKEITDQLTGESPYHLILKTPYMHKGGISEMQLRCDLVGFGIQLPKPFYKPAQMARKLDLTLQFRENQDKQLRFVFGKQIKGLVEFKEKQPMPLGEILIGYHKMTPKRSNEKLRVVGRLNQLRWSDWEPFFKKAQNTLPILPIEFDIFAKKFFFSDCCFSALTLGFQPNRDTKSIQLASDFFKGEILLPVGDQKKLGLIFDFLKFPEIKQRIVIPSRIQLSNDFLKPWPALEIVCDKLYWHNNLIGSFLVNLLSNQTGYEITNAKLSRSDYDLGLTGHWGGFKNQDLSLSGDLKTRNLGNFLGEFQSENPFVGGNGQILFDLAWKNWQSPQFFSQTTGNVEIDLKSGQIQGVDPGIARILGLLTLDNLERRLRLDFKDLTEKGFSYDTFLANIEFRGNQAHTEKFFIDSPSAKVKLKGDFLLTEKTLDLRMKVLPKISSTAIPVAAAVAVNPAVGAAIWVLDKISGQKINQIVQYHYHLTGPWQSPVIKALQKVAKNAKSAKDIKKQN